MHEDWRDMYIAQKLQYKTAQFGHTAREVEVQPLSHSLTLPLNSNPGTPCCVTRVLFI